MDSDIVSEMGSMTIIPEVEVITLPTMLRVTGRMSRTQIRVKIKSADYYNFGGTDILMFFAKFGDDR
jgi:hypothetical protein